MLKSKDYYVFLLTLCATLLFGLSANAQTSKGNVEEYSGTAISFNGPRTVTGLFNLRVTGQTSDEQARQYLATLQENGQDKVLDAIRKNDLGSFSFDGQLGRTLNVVRESTVEGRRRVFIVFERWTQFAEVRGGYRSLDYPFGVIELFFDDATGKGEGTYIAAARVRWVDDKNTVEIENFATYPVKLTAVTRRDNRPKR